MFASQTTDYQRMGSAGKIDKSNSVPGRIFPRLEEFQIWVGVPSNV